MEEVHWSQRQDTNILFCLFVQPIWSDSPFPIFKRVSTQVHSHFPAPDFCKCCQQCRLRFCVPIAVIDTIRTLRHWHLLPRSSNFRCLCLFAPPHLISSVKISCSVFGSYSPPYSWICSLPLEHGQPSRGLTLEKADPLSLGSSQFPMTSYLGPGHYTHFAPGWVFAWIELIQVFGMLLQ